MTSIISPATGLPVWQVDPGTGNSIQTGRVTSGDGLVLTQTNNPTPPSPGDLLLTTPDGITLNIVAAQSKTTTLAVGGLSIKEGTNARMGTAVLVAGTVVVADTSVTASTRIFLTPQVPGGTVGAPYVSARTAGTSFTITSTSGTDTSTVAYLLVEPN